jgi:hypothetical protein
VSMRLKQPIRVSYFSARPVLDGYRIFFDRISNPVEKKKPNVAVIYLADLRDQKSLVTKLRQSEKDAGMDRLPLIVISPIPASELDSQLMIDRTHMVLPTSVPISQLFETIDHLLRD